MSALNWFVIELEPHKTLRCIHNCFGVELRIWLRKHPNPGFAPWKFLRRLASTGLVMEVPCCQMPFSWLPGGSGPDQRVPGTDNSLSVEPLPLLVPHARVPANPKGLSCPHRVWGMPWQGHVFFFLLLRQSPGSYLRGTRQSGAHGLDLVPCNLRFLPLVRCHGGELGKPGGQTGSGFSIPAGRTGAGQKSQSFCLESTKTRPVWGHAPQASLLTTSSCHLLRAGWGVLGGFWL